MLCMMCEWPSVILQRQTVSEKSALPPLLSSANFYLRGCVNPTSLLALAAGKVATDTNFCISEPDTDPNWVGSFGFGRFKDMMPLWENGKFLISEPDTDPNWWFGPIHVTTCDDSSRRNLGRRCEIHTTSLR